MHLTFSRKPINIYTEFIPQILFLCCLFGYLALLMFIKWAKYYANADPANFGLSERCAPSILITFINMVLFRGNEGEQGCDPYLYSGNCYLVSLKQNYFTTSANTLTY